MLNHLIQGLLNATHTCINCRYHYGGDAKDHFASNANKLVRVICCLKRLHISAMSPQRKTAHVCV